MYKNVNLFLGGSENNFHFEYVPKDSTGTRSGIILSVELGKSQNEKWQVKTHHHGGSTFNSDTGPDIRELFCYKMFELIRVSLDQSICKSNFLS